MPLMNPSDGDRAVAEQILRTFATITVVGASADPSKAAHYVPAHMREHGWRVVSVNPRRPVVFGEAALSALADVAAPVDFVNVFRPSEQTPDVVRQAIAVGAKAVWLQLGIASAEARHLADKAGLLYVEDRCLLQDQRAFGLEAPTT